jgi:hypothetical protein
VAGPTARPVERESVKKELSKIVKGKQGSQDRILIRMRIHLAWQTLLAKVLISKKTRIIRETKLWSSYQKRMRGTRNPTGSSR